MTKKSAANNARFRAGRESERKRRGPNKVETI